MLATLKAQLVEKKVLSDLAVGASAPVEMSGFSDVSPGVSQSSKLANVEPILTGLWTSLAFEQQKQLLLLQLQHEQNNALELKMLRQHARLREAELAHVERKSQLELERYKLELISEGKLQPEPLKVKGPVVSVSQTLSFDVALNLQLIPKFNEKDPDIFFVLF